MIILSGAQRRVSLEINNNKYIKLVKRVKAKCRDQGFEVLCTNIIVKQNAVKC